MSAGRAFNFGKEKKVLKLKLEAEEPTIHMKYPQAIDMEYLPERIHMPLNNFEIKFKKGAGYSLLKEMI